MKNKKISLLLCGALSLISSAALAYERDPVTYGCTVRLKHEATGKYLTDAEENYTHVGASGQKAVYGGNDANMGSARWIVKGKHSGDRWNFDLNADDTARSMIGWPVKINQVLRLENAQTGRNLHGHDSNAPKVTSQYTVTAFGSNGNGDTNDNWVVAEIVRDSGSGYLSVGYKVKLKHEGTGRFLHSHPAMWKPGKNEITTYTVRDNNDWWTIEVVDQPNNNTVIKAKYDESRSTNLTYWTPLFWDAETGQCSANYASRRLWVHGGNRHDGGNNNPPHDHLELLAGPWSDYRAKEGPSFFVIHNADDKFKTGPINFGDRIKIMAVHGGLGEGDKSGLLLPFRYLWMHSDSRHGSAYREIIVSRPEHPSATGIQAVFTLEPIINGQTGPISSMDLVRIKNVQYAAYCWTHADSRHGGAFHELLAEDPWGKSNFGVGRQASFEKYRFSLALPATVANETAKTHLVAVNKEIEEMFGPLEAAKQKALVAEVARSAAAQATALEDAKNDAAAKERARLEAVDRLSAQQTLAAAQQQELDTAKKALEEAKQKAQEEKDAAAIEFNKKLDTEALKAKAQEEKAARIAAELEEKMDMPIGFAGIPGAKVKSIAFGLQDRELEKVIDNKGTKEKQLIFDDFGVIILADGSLGQYKLGADPANPWQHVPLADASGAAIKAVAATVATDGTTYVVSEDGKLYGISWPDDTPAAMPQEEKGFEAADKKAEQRKEQKAKKAKTKAKKAKGKKAKKKDKKVKKGKKAVVEGADVAVVEERDLKEAKKAKGKKGKKAKAAAVEGAAVAVAEVEERDHKEAKKSKGKHKGKGKGKKAKAADVDTAVSN